ncbi:hypothetical protein M9H77_26857 [Catharanthus roseus]|uniref:Uncharacterized protein n=1 Tax=Catharanthus roseus TaxID=4058 RepID=A0ACC0AD04_CATRO|nr:hypothetical protein M9H77_26857 [Catharanthus roseus]
MRLGHSKVLSSPSAIEVPVSLQHAGEVAVNSQVVATVADSSVAATTEILPAANIQDCIAAAGCLKETIAAPIGLKGQPEAQLHLVSAADLPPEAAIVGSSPRTHGGSPLPLSKTNVGSSRTLSQKPGLGQQNEISTASAGIEDRIQKQPAHVFDSLHDVLVNATNRMSIMSAIHPNDDKKDSNSNSDPSNPLSSSPDEDNLELMELIRNIPHKAPLFTNKNLATFVSKASSVLKSSGNRQALLNNFNDFSCTLASKFPSASGQVICSKNTAAPNLQPSNVASNNESHKSGCLDFSD